MAGPGDEAGSGAGGRNRALPFTISVIGVALVTLVAIYAGGDVGGLAAGSAIDVLPWSDGRPGWIDGQQPGGLRGASDLAGGSAGGLFTVKVPYRESAAYKIQLYLINADQVAAGYQFLAMCVQAAPAIAESYYLVEDRRLFVDSSRLNNPSDGSCKVISTDQISAEIVVDSRDGTIADAFGRTAGHPDFVQPSWRVFNIGITDGTVRAKPGTTVEAPRFLIDVVKA